MKTRALLLALPLLAAVGCNQNRASVQIQDICSATDDCTFADKCDTVALGNPRLDLGTTNFLTLPLQLENQTPDNTNLAIGRTNTNDAHLDEAVVEYSGGLSGRVVFEVNGRVPANGTTVFFVDIIPAAVGGSTSMPTLGAGESFELVATLRLRGFYDDGTRFETGEFPVATTICNGCAPVCASGIYCPQAGQYPVACGTL